MTGLFLTLCLASTSPPANSTTLWVCNEGMIQTYADLLTCENKKDARIIQWHDAVDETLNLEAKKDGVTWRVSPRCGEAPVSINRDFDD